MMSHSFRAAQPEGSRQPITRGTGWPKTGIKGCKQQAQLQWRQATWAQAGENLSEGWHKREGSICLSEPFSI